ncbi:MAG: MtrB/PioB family outer membrane beta-barrel protein [Candidatus Latescibacterota bacterium]
MRTRLVVLLAVAAASALPAAGQDAGAVQARVRISSGMQQLDNSTGSSKFTEYRDLRDDFYVYGSRLDLFHPRGLFLDLAATNPSRRDQSVRLGIGDVGAWRVDATWNETPHVLSYKALSPYVERVAGRLEVPQTMVLPIEKLGTAAADTASVRAADAVMRAYAESFAAPIELGNQTKTGTVALRYEGLDGADLSVGYTRRTQTGNRPSFGPIGDRPPRTLNIALAEPVDYRTEEVRLAAERNGGAYQARLEYTFSAFANEVDQLEWQNIYVTPEAGATFDQWDRLVSAFGRRPLAPDNTYHNATLSGGANLPRASRLTASLSYGRLQQDEALVPYSFHADALANATLPRTTADAQMNLTHLAAEYSIALLPRVGLRAFYRRSSLDNQTPASQWQYVTQDASNANGSVSYKNKRISVPYAWDRQSVGLGATWRTGLWRSALELGLEREDTGRDYREADTGENIGRLRWRARPTDWLSLRAGYLRGDRDGGTYNAQVTRQTYWYAPAEAGTDNDNPQFTFTNHPDMRRYDVSDRQRDQLDLTASLAPGAQWSLSTTVRLRRDDFDSGVQPSQPLIGTSLEEREAESPGDQLGLLEDERRQVTVDLFYAPVEPLALSAFAGWDVGKSGQRSLEYDENAKQTPGEVTTAVLGPWTRAGSQWTADVEDQTRYAGVGGTWRFAPSPVSLSANYTVSLGRMDVDYAGYGVTSFDGTPFATNYQFAFQSPPSVEHDSHVADVRLEFPLVDAASLQLGYTFDYYRIRDWQQQVNTPWFESGDDQLVTRDTSRSHQWGNRLFTMGGTLAPDYKAHTGYMIVTYSFGAGM